MHRLMVVTGVLMTLSSSILGAAEAPDWVGSEAWARVLGKFANQGGVDYAALQENRADLDRFLAALGPAQVEGLSRAAQIAFWCNAYNAVVVHHVLERYPEIGSVKEVSGFFNDFRFLVAGREMTLDEIESEARHLGEARVHFAVVCASTSCPDLRSEPYREEILDQQLQEDTERFLSDPGKGLVWDREENSLYLSSIFKWYAGDFTGGSTVVAYFSRGRVLDWVLPHLSAELAAQVEQRQPKIRYLEYDWSLNDRPRR